MGTRRVITAPEAQLSRRHSDVRRCVIPSTVVTAGTTVAVGATLFIRDRVQIVIRHADQDDSSRTARRYWRTAFPARDPALDPCHRSPLGVTKHGSSRSGNAD